ncbi:hypothetical protein BGZ61DRAFT_471283 [Ilyonectria robusta]|uniref:uncharacterized protein n=1 Tax=Ilyonectria robusta TaxID=1079257 RepID=UPI001E8D024D|nr:uncharacterized protein BGZ61DRAFT_471283 [Ilyonectria robusta]KAH8737894.1 hypothetical protein BGZ61DRAFT_471283 [Ilyonectria robusta]
MPDSPPATLASLPPEIIKQIFSFMPRPALPHLRLLDHRLGFIATALAFRTVLVRAFGDSPQHFIHIAQSDKLCGLVREMTCDTWFGPDHEDRRPGRDEVPRGFMATLPSLRFFHGLKTLHLRSSQHCGREGRRTRVPIETDDFRYRVLDVVFNCLAGTWSAGRQQQIDQSLGLQTRHGIPLSENATAPISLSALTISNLGDNNDTRLSGSDAFKEVLASSNLVDLKIYITTQLSTYGGSRSICYRDKHAMFESLPSTWLSQPVASNLKVLSLYCYEYWGWNPKLDLRTVGAGGGMPNLKVLALGKYVFSHEWQADWFPSLGLEELYLDDCRIVYQSRTDWTPDDRTNVVGQDANGHDVVISSKGYLRYDDVWDLDTDPDAALDSNYTGEEITADNIRRRFKLIRFNIRWHTLFSRWRDSMSTLKVFKMGYGAWDEELQKFPRNMQPSRLNSLVLDRTATIRAHSLKYNAFRDFDSPSLDVGGTKARMKYIYDDTYQWYEWRDWVDGWGSSDSSQWVLEDDVEAKDEAALELFLSTVNARRK